MKLGIIQTRGGGDIIIALPIAKYFFNRGYDVHWIIDQNFYEAFKYAAPYVNFIPISVEESEIQSNIRHPYWFETPKKMLTDINCDNLLCFPFEETRHLHQIKLYSRLTDSCSIRAKELKLSHHTSFDSFKYAVAGVPFKEKWNLDIRRNLEKEMELFNKVILDPSVPYTLINDVSSMGRTSYTYDKTKLLSDLGIPNMPIIETKMITDNLFDWLTIIERCHCFIGLDSAFVNLIEQLQLKIKKFFIRRSPLHFTPVLREDWDYIPVNLPQDEGDYTLQF